MPFKMMATGESARAVSSPPTTTWVSITKMRRTARGTHLVLSQFQGLIFVQRAPRPRLLHKIKRLFARFDPVKDKTFINQLTNGFSALSRSFF